jgi:hypothetical protein
VALNPSGVASPTAATASQGQRYNTRISLILSNEKRYNSIYIKMGLLEIYIIYCISPLLKDLLVNVTLCTCCPLDPWNRCVAILPFPNMVSSQV